MRNLSIIKKLPSKSRIGPHNIDIISLLFGSSLGDSYGEYRHESVRFILQQENPNCEYLSWYHKYLATRGYCSPEKPKLYKRIGGNGKIRFYHRVSSYSFGSLKWLYDSFYGDGKKRIPETGALEELLTPLAIAVWIMDDGSWCSVGTKIATNSFTMADLLRMRQVLENKYNLFVSIQKTGVENQYLLYFQKTSMPTLARLVEPYIVKSMHHKLNGWLYKWIEGEVPAEAQRRGSRLAPPAECRGGRPGNQTKGRGPQPLVK